MLFLFYQLIVLNSNCNGKFQVIQFALKFNIHKHDVIIIIILIHFKSIIFYVNVMHFNINYNNISLVLLKFGSKLSKIDVNCIHNCNAKEI